jgi:hypothetical protein
VAGISSVQLLGELGRRHIPINYEPDDLQADIATPVSGWLAWWFKRNDLAEFHPFAIRCTLLRRRAAFICQMRSSAKPCASQVKHAPPITERR